MLPTVSPQVWIIRQCQSQGHLSLVENPIGNAKMEVAPPFVVPPVENPFDNVKDEVSSPLVDIYFDDAKVDVSPQVDIPSINANVEVPDGML